MRRCSPTSYDPCRRRDDEAGKVTYSMVLKICPLRVTSYVFISQARILFEKRIPILRKFWIAVCRHSFDQKQALLKGKRANQGIQKRLDSYFRLE